MQFTAIYLNNMQGLKKQQTNLNKMWLSDR